MSWGGRRGCIWRRRKATLYLHPTHNIPGGGGKAVWVVPDLFIGLFMEMISLQYSWVRCTNKSPPLSSHSPMSYSSSSFSLAAPLYALLTITNIVSWLSVGLSHSQAVAELSFSGAYRWIQLWRGRQSKSTRPPAGHTQQVSEDVCSWNKYAHHGLGAVSERGRFQGGYLSTLWRRK